VVEAGAGLVVIEAMKMQNELRAPADGIVASIEVEEGQTVDRDKLLVRFERESDA
jgi:pyruvate carboxylase subunit B